MTNKDLSDWLDHTDAWDEFNEWMEPRRAAHTARQVHANWMLYMRRMMGEIATILRLQDIDCELTDEECDRLLEIAGFDEAEIDRILQRLLKQIEQ